LRQHTDLEVRIGAYLVRHRWAMFWIGLALSTLSAFGLARAELRNDFRSFIGENSPALQSTDWLSRRMVDSVETAVLLYQPADGRVFTDVGLLQYAQIGERARSLPYVRNARSLFDAEKLVLLRDGATRDRVVVAPFMSGVDLFSDAGRAAISGDAASSPTIRARFISADGRSAAVHLSLELSRDADERLNEIASLRAQIRALQDDVSTIRDGDTIRLAGVSLFDEATFQVFRTELPPLFAIAFLLITAMIFFLYRSMAFTAVALFVIVTPVVATAGLAAALGLEFSVLTASGLLLVGTLAVADVLHIANAFFLLTGTGLTADSALRSAIGKNLWAVCATSTTTAIGEVVLLFSASPAVQTMGQTIIIGVIVALVLALLMLPGPLSRMKSHEPRPLRAISQFFATLARDSATHPRVVLTVFAIVLSAACVGIARSDIRDNVTEWFAKGVEFRESMEAFDNQYSGSQAVTVAVETTLAEVAALRSYPPLAPRLAPFVAFREQLNAIEPTPWMSPIDTMNATVSRLQAPETSFRTAPENAQGLKAAGAGVVAESGLFTPFEAGHADYSLWRSDWRATSSFETVRNAKLAAAAARAALPDRDVRVAGIGYAFAQVSVVNFYNILGSSIAVLAVIVACLMAVFRSVRLGLMSIIPNTAPLLAVYGAWGLLYGQFNLAAVTMFSVALGIVVDDTIHFVLMYQRQRRAGDRPLDAIEKAVHGSSGGVLATTLIITAGFLLLALTSFQLTAQKAAMTAAAIGVALLFDVTMLPALLVMTDGRRSVAATPPDSQH